MSNSSQVKEAIITTIEDLESSFGSDNPCAGDVRFKDLKKEIGDYNGEKSALLKIVESTESAHNNYCIAFDDLESAKNEFQNTPDESEEEEYADQCYSDAVDHFSNESGRFSEAIQDLRFALQNVD